MSARAIEPKEVKTIPMSSIIKGHRYREDLGNINELQDSISANGLWHPIVVMEFDEPEEGVEQKYALIAGGRRFAACTNLGWTEIRATIYPHSLNDHEKRLLELLENIDRKDMEYQEQVALTACVHKTMQDLCGRKGAHPDSEGHSLRGTARMLGRSAASVSQDIKLAEAIEAIPELAKAKDKKEAFKLLKHLEQNFEAKQIADRIESERAATPEEVFKRQIMNGYMVKDFFEGIKDVPSNSIDLIELDPDWGDIDLESRPVENQALHDMKLAGYTQKDKDVNVLDYYERIIRECTRVLSPTGWMLVWFAYHPNGNAIWSLLEKYDLRGPGTPCIWAKPSGQVRSADTNLPRGYECFYYARKPDARLARQGRLDIFSYRTVSPESRIHITEKPVEMMCDIYQTFVKPGSRIMIPFLGSGNGILAAYNIGCTAFGYDLNQTTKDKFTIRVNNNNPPNYSSYR
jgi:ParB/RepB/Spo0J family partition protein